MEPFPENVDSLNVKVIVNRETRHLTPSQHQTDISMQSNARNPENKFL